MNLAKRSIERPVATIMLMLAVILVGAVSFTRLNVDLMPNISPPVAAIITRFPGASAQEVQDLVTIQVEAIAGTTAGIKEITSVSQEGMSLVVLMFEWGKDVSSARQDVAAKLDLIGLPEDAARPITVEFDPTLLPIMQVTISQSVGMGDTTAFVRDRVKPRLEAIEGVAAVDLVGAAERRLSVWLDPEKLSAYGLSQEGVAQVIAASNLNYPLGEVVHEGLEVQMRMLGTYETVDDIGNTVVGFAPRIPKGQEAGTDGAPAMAPVLLKDVARIEEGYAEVTSFTRVNGKPGVTLAVHREGTSNTVSVVRAVRKELDRISDDLGIDATVSMDQARFIELAIAAVEQNLLLGAGLAVVILLLFLRDVRTTLVISLSIPFSVISTFILMYGGKLTLNVMTLGGLALGVGMLVDNSIVVIENVFRHVQDGEVPRVAAEAGTQEVASAITASTLTTIVVFLPVIFTGGITGIVFKELTWTVTFSLVASLLVALTVVPMLSSRLFGRRKKRGGVDGGTERKHAQGIYSRSVAWCLQNRVTVLLLAAAVLGGTAYLARQIPSEFLPVADEGSFTMGVSVKPGTPLEELDRVIGSIESILAKDRTVDNYSVTAGESGEISSLRSSVMGGVDAEILVTVDKKTADKKETAPFMRSIQKRVDDVRGDAQVTYNMTSSLTMMAGNLPTQIQVKVTGPDVVELGKLADELVLKMRDIEGLGDPRSSLAEKKPEIHLSVDKEKAMGFGLTPAQIALAVSRSVKGQTVSRYRSGDAFVDVVLVYEEEAVRTPEAIGDLLLTGRGGQVLVKDVATIESGRGPLAIVRQDRRLCARVTAEITGRSLGAVSDDVSSIIDEMRFSDGYEATLGGVSQIMAEGFSALKLALVLAAVLVYMVMAASFESVAQPLIIMLTLPLAAVGVVIALYVSNYSFGVTAFIGVIILAGVVVNNGIVMVDFMNQLRKAGYAVRDAVVQGAAKRLRPVLMTSLTTVVGLLPMALGVGQGGELEAPLALSLMGGITSGTLLTLFVIPVVYSLVTRDKAAALPAVHPTPPSPILPEEQLPGAGVDVKVPPTGRPASGDSQTGQELVLGSAFDSEDMAELIELLGKLFTSVRRKSV